MSLAPMNPYQLVEGTVDHGLSFVATYLEKVVQHPAIITDHIGYIHYPVVKEISLPIDDLFMGIPQEIVEGQPLYKQNDLLLYYAIGQSDGRGYVIINNIPESKVPDAVAAISNASLAIKIHFSNLVKIRHNSDFLIHEFAEDLFLKSQINIGNVIKQSYQSLDSDKPYFIKNVQVEESAQEIDLRLIGAYALEYLKRDNIHIIPVPWPNSLLSIVPARFKENTLEVDPNWPKLAHNIKWKEDIEKKFNCVLSCGLGRSYTLRDLHKSYNEACIALTMARLLGKKSFVQHFSDLGVFTFIFSQNIEDIKQYYHKTLSQLINYDEKFHAELIPTLRILVDHGFNRRSTADSLFIHINTLHYRIAKIEQMLGLDLAQTDSRFNLFVAIKVYDTLRINGFLN